MKIEIEKDIPIPGLARNVPFDQMDVGDSFRVPPEISHGYMRLLIAKFQQKSPKRFSLRRVGEGYRCWRVA